MLRVVTPLNKGTKTKLRPLGCAATFRTNACGAAVRAEATKLAKAIAPTQYAVGRKAARNHSRETLLGKPRSRPHDRFSLGVRVLQDSDSMCPSPCAENGLRLTCGGPHSTHRQLHGYHSAGPRIREWGHSNSARTVCGAWNADTLLGTLRSIAGIEGLSSLETARKGSHRQVGIPKVQRSGQPPACWRGLDRDLWRAHIHAQLREPRLQPWSDFLLREGASSPLSISHVFLWSWALARVRSAKNTTVSGPIPCFCFPLRALEQAVHPWRGVAMRVPQRSSTSPGFALASKGNRWDLFLGIE